MERERTTLRSASASRSFLLFLVLPGDLPRLPYLTPKAGKAVSARKDVGKEAVDFIKLPAFPWMLTPSLSSFKPYTIEFLGVNFAEMSDGPGV